MTTLKKGSTVCPLRHRRRVCASLAVVFCSSSGAPATRTRASRKKSRRNRLLSTVCPFPPASGWRFIGAATPPDAAAKWQAPRRRRRLVNSLIRCLSGVKECYDRKKKVELLADWFGSLERCQTSVARPCSSPIDSERKGRITRMQIRPRLALPEINDPQVISAAPVVYFASAFHLLGLTMADFLGRCKSVADSSSPSLTTISRQTMKMVNAPMDSVGFRSACLVQKEAKFSGG